jgi:hypothetical protein
MKHIARSIMFVLATQIPAYAAQAPDNRTGVTVISGGIGIAERETLAEAARGFNLKLVFVLSTGNYLSDVPFDIVDKSGKLVASHVASGPVAYAKLPPGIYRLTARFGEAPQSRTVTVQRRGQQTVYFRWRGLGDKPVA